jgi:hypothetical protein
MRDLSLWHRHKSPVWENILGKNFAPIPLRFCHEASSRRTHGGDDIRRAVNTALASSDDDRVKKIRRLGEMSKRMAAAECAVPSVGESEMLTCRRGVSAANGAVNEPRARRNTRKMS